MLRWSAWPCVVAALAAAAPTVVGPPGGAHYAKSVSFPLIGRAQRIELHVLDAKRATLRMAGIINHEETLTYEVLRDQRIAFELSDRLTATMRRCGSQLTLARYDALADAAIVRVRIALLGLPVVIRMPRVGASRD